MVSWVSLSLLPGMYYQKYYHSSNSITLPGTLLYSTLLYHCRYGGNLSVPTNLQVSSHSQSHPTKLRTSSIIRSPTNIHIILLDSFLSFYLFICCPSFYFFSLKLASIRLPPVKLQKHSKVPGSWSSFLSRNSSRSSSNRPIQPKNKRRKACFGTHHRKHSLRLADDSLLNSIIKKFTSLSYNASIEFNKTGVKKSSR